MVLAHHVLGVHRRMLWGFDAALVWALLRSDQWAWITALRLWFAAPEGWLEWLRWRNLFLLLLLNMGLVMVLIWPLFCLNAILIPLYLWRRIR